MVQWILGVGGQGYIARKDVRQKFTEAQSFMLRKQTLVKYCEDLRTGAMPYELSEEDLASQGGRATKKTPPPLTVKMTPVPGGG